MTVTGQPRGYAFVQFESIRHAQTAYRACNGLDLNGQPLLVDFERGRGMPGWVPRRLDRGLYITLTEWAVAGVGRCIQQPGSSPKLLNTTFIGGVLRINMSPLSSETQQSPRQPRSP
ncbi:hypothetical protein BC831DRAFT_514946 [Entophlyctis helioformis]|nr:hypothetical protein BC831DRAFT_514946 [Entophlyctis helioformis]